jgi:hypothetical protein
MERLAPLRRAPWLLALVALTWLAPAHLATADDLRVFPPSATISAADTVTLPLHEGRRDGETIWFVALDASGASASKAWGVNRADKLDHARGTAAVQRVTVDAAGRIVFPASVDFRPERVVVPSPGTGFPPLGADPGSVGENGYSPLIQLPDGSILNAPHVANGSGVHDKVVAIDLVRRQVRLATSDGFAGGKLVHYVSTDASDAAVAALEGATFAPLLTASPRAGDDSSASARASLAAFTNGPTGDPSTRQGLNSALLGEGDPLNVLAWTPNQGRYSPLWDVHVTAWTPENRPVRVTSFGDVLGHAAHGRVTAPDGSTWHAQDVIVNCPIIARAG